MTLHDGLAVYRFGSGLPVFLMPGPHRFERPGLPDFDALIEGFVRLNHEVITFDPPGSGHSTRPARLGMAEMHTCADEALDACGITGPATLCGHSMGGLVTLAYALERAQRAARLILVGTGSGGPAYMHAPGALWRHGHPGFIHMALLGILHTLWPRRAPETLLLNVIERHSYYDPTRAAPTRVAWRDWLRPDRGRSDWHWIARKLDYRSQLHAIHAPALVLCGRHDPQFPPSASQELAARLPHAQIVWFEQSGHYPFIEEPAAFWAAVERFLRQTV